MSHEIDMTLGRPAMAYTGDTPWHGLGTSLQPDATIEVWREASGLNWRAERSPILYRTSTRKRLSSAVGPVDVDLGVWPKQEVLFRSDTKAPLGIVSSRYQIVQPGAVLEFFQRLIEGVGGFSMETAGSLYDGKKIWALAKSERGFSVGDDDAVDRYLLLATSYDKSFATTVRQTSVRVVCWNTLSAALQPGEDVIIQKHVRKFRPELIREQMHLDETWREFRKACKRLVGIKISNDQAMHIFKALFADEKYVNSGHYSAAGERRLLDRVWDVYENAPGQGLDTTKGTAWGLLNCVTRFVDHASRARRPDNRLNRAWFGSGAILKSKTLALLLAQAN